MSAKIFEDDRGNRSSMRWIWAICTLTIFGVWAIISISQHELQSFGTGDAILVASLFGGKVAQKYIEKQKP